MMGNDLGDSNDKTDNIIGNGGGQGSLQEQPELFRVKYSHVCVFAALIMSDSLRPHGQ